MTVTYCTRGAIAYRAAIPPPVMAGLVPAIHVFLAAPLSRPGCPGHRRAEATPSFGRLCPGMTVLISPPHAHIPQHEAGPSGAADSVAEIVRRRARIGADAHLIEGVAAAAAHHRA